MILDVYPTLKTTNGYPASICVSVNDEVVHGIPIKGSHFLQEGDIVSLDAGLIYKGFHPDAALGLGVGRDIKRGQTADRCYSAKFFEGINLPKEGSHLYEISAAIQDYVEGYGYSVVRDLVGHGIEHISTKTLRFLISNQGAGA